MREIKFRFVVNGRLKYSPNRNFSLVFDDQGIKILQFHRGAIIAEHIPKEVMQYTGLKDKNGKEIYEGDILFTNDDPGECREAAVNVIVEYNDEFAKWEIFNKDFRLDLGYYPFDEIEVIGNIYENPELLTQEEKR